MYAPSNIVKSSGEKHGTVSEAVQKMKQKNRLKRTATGPVKHN